MADLTHTLDIPSLPRQALAETLRSVLPAELSRLFFGGPTGSDAVESASSWPGITAGGSWSPSRVLITA
jgi:4-aminobutyrate aminotransferase-like enzyme